jgi:hypothetical protein
MRTATKKPSYPKTVEQYINCEWGTWAPGDRIPVDTPLSKCQRDYKKQNVYKYIAKVKGLDRNLFGYATAVRRKSDGALALINGQHRIQLVKIVSPSTQEVPAQIIEVDDADFDTYGSKLFHEFNGTVSKGLSNEEVFYAKVLAKDIEALDTEKVLKLAGLSCGKVNALQGSYPVEYATFVKCLKLSPQLTIRASKMLTTGFRSCNTDVLHGLVFLFNHPHYAELADNTKAVGQHFETWLTKFLPGVGLGISDLKYKQYRQGAWQKGVAYGIAKSFAKRQRNHGLYAPTITEIKKIYEDGYQKEDSGIL